MTWKRLLLAVAAASVGSAPAWADQVTPSQTQDQANRLSLFHDYGLDAVGNVNSVDLPVNVGNPNDVAFAIPGLAGGGLLTGVLPSSMSSTDPTGTGRPFDLSLTPIAGYDANPEGRRLPRASVFGGGELAAAYHVTDGPDDPIVGQPLRATFAYSALGAVYEGQTQNADTLQQNLSASVRQTLFANSIVLSSTLGDAFTMEHGSAFLDTFDAGATGEFFFLPQASIEAGYDYAHLQYFFTAILPAQKPTADRDTFVAKGHLYTLSQRRGATIDEAPDQLTEILRGMLRRVTVNYDHVWNLPTEDNGHDYKYEANRVGIGLEGMTAPSQVATTPLGRFTRNLSFDLDYDHEFQNYEYANTESPPVYLTNKGSGTTRELRRFHRKDGIDVLTYRGNARLLDLPHDAGTLAGYVQWDLTHDGSNIVARHYNEYVITGGLTYRY